MRRQVVHYFSLKDLEISMDQDAFLPMQQMNSLRRAALDGLRREIATAFLQGMQSFNDTGRNI